MTAVRKPTVRKPTVRKPTTIGGGGKEVGNGGDNKANNKK